jgi:D-serine dehydratase
MADPAALDAGFQQLDDYYLAAKESSIREFLSTYMLPKNKDGHLVQ